MSGQNQKDQDGAKAKEEAGEADDGEGEEEGQDEGQKSSSFF